MTKPYEIYKMEKQSRQKGWEIEAEKRRNATECKNGHKYTPENIIWRTKKGKSYRNCRICTLAGIEARKMGPRQEPLCP